MTTRFDLVLQGGTVFTPSGLVNTDLAIADGRIAGFGDFAGADTAQRWSVPGITILPGVVDSQVHFREPGLEHKEDLESGTRSAALGGVTAVFEMPNTRPATTTRAALADKLARAVGRAHVDHAFFVGATGENAQDLPMLERLAGCCGVKLFMGASTGDLLVPDDEGLGAALRMGRRRMAVHCEDEARLRERRAIADAAAGDASVHPHWRDAESARLATERLLRLARRVGRPVHVLHVTTAEEMALLAANRDIASVEVTPQHLTLAAPDCYRDLGSFAQMNPPIREAHHRTALWNGLAAGVVDVIGSDHAPHTREEKAKPYPASPSGMPGVQTLVPVMLTHVAAGRLSLARFVDLTSAGVQRLYGMAGKGRIALGYDGDLTLVDLAARRVIGTDWVASRCGWTPFEGMEAGGWPVGTIVRGHVVMRDGAIVSPPIGAPVRFVDTLAPQAEAA